MSTIDSATTDLIAASVAAATSSSSTANTTDSDEIDWDGLVDEAVNAKLSKADSIDLKITENETTIAAYKQMQSLLEAVEGAADVLRAASGSSATSSDVFLGRSAYLTATGDTDASSALGVTVEAGADTASYELKVSQLAMAHKVIGTTVSSSSSELAFDGVISLGTDAGTSADIEISADMTLAEIAEAINAVSDTSGVKASVLEVADSDYRLILTSVETSETIIASAVFGDDVLNSLGILDSQSDFVNELQAATQAVFTLDGVEITRSSNDVDDLLDGVTLHLYQTVGVGEAITLEIDANLGVIKDAIVALADAYNAYRDFAYEQQQIPGSTDADGEASDSTLFGDGTLRNVNTSIASALTAQIGEANLAKLGLTFDASNNLELDEEVLDTILTNDLEAVESLLSFGMTASSTKLLLLSRGTSVPEDFTLDIVVDASGDVTSVSIDGNEALFTVNGTRIIGVEGTDYEGYTFVYIGTESQSVDVGFTTGIAELLYNVSHIAADETSGSLSALIENLEGVNDTYEAKSDDIRTRAETYRTNLTNRYAQYQAAIESAESILDYLTALIDSWNS